MPSPTLLRLLLDHGLLPGHTPIDVRVPTRHAPSVIAVWHAHPGCLAGVRTRTRTLSAADLLDQVTDPDTRAVLCACSTENAAAYLPGLCATDRSAVEWAAAVDRATEHPTVESTAKARTLLATRPPAIAPDVAAAADRVTTTATSRLAGYARDAEYRWTLLCELHRGAAELYRHTHHASSPRRGVNVLAAHPDTGPLLDQLAADAAVAACHTTWVDTVYEDRKSLVDTGLDTLGHPRVWVRIFDHYDTLLGVADQVVRWEESVWLARVPVLACCHVTEPVAVIAVDDGYAPDTVAAAARLAGVDTVTGDLVAAMHTART